MADMVKARERNHPRISVNKLSEYITALPGRRKSIIKGQKRPQSFIVPYYNEAEDVIIEYLTTHWGNEDWINSKILELSNRSVKSDWDENRRDICIGALESFLELLEALDLGDLSCVAGEHNPPKLHIADVEVSVRPEIYLIDTSGSTQGCVKLVFGKGRDLSETEAGYTGTCLQSWMMQQFNISNHKTCFVIDVSGEKYHMAPKAYKKRKSDIEAACEEIARAWSTA